MTVRALRAVRYDAQTDRLRLVFAGNRALEVPRKNLAELEGFGPDELARLKAGNAGATISLRERDLDISVPGLLRQLFSLG